MFYDRLSYETDVITRFRMRLLSSMLNVACLVTMPWSWILDGKNPAFKVSHVINKKSGSHMILSVTPEIYQRLREIKDHSASAVCSRLIPNSKG